MKLVVSAILVASVLNAGCISPSLPILHPEPSVYISELPEIVERKNRLIQRMRLERHHVPTNSSR